MIFNKQFFFILLAFISVQCCNAIGINSTKPTGPSFEELDAILNLKKNAKDGEDDFVKFKDEKIELYYPQSSILLMGFAMPIIMEMSFLICGLKYLDDIKEKLLPLVGLIGAIALVDYFYFETPLYKIFKMCCSEPFLVFSKDGLQIDNNPIVSWDKIQKIAVKGEIYGKYGDAAHITELGSARWQAERVHSGVDYDLMLDTHKKNMDDNIKSIIGCIEK